MIDVLASSSAACIPLLVSRKRRTRQGFIDNTVVVREEAVQAYICLVIHVFRTVTPPPPLLPSHPQNFDPVLDT
jgi:hypothetical protein